MGVWWKASARYRCVTCGVLTNDQVIQDWDESWDSYYTVGPAICDSCGAVVEEMDDDEGEAGPA